MGRGFSVKCNECDNVIEVTARTEELNFPVDVSVDKYKGRMYINFDCACGNMEEAEGKYPL